MVNTCASFGCLSNSKYDKDRRFFRFPKDINRCKAWVEASGRPELWEKGPENLYRSYFVCDLHFHAKDRLVKNLRRFAIPMPFDSEPIPIEDDDECTQADSLIKEEFPIDIGEVIIGPSTSNISSVSLCTSEESSSSTSCKRTKSDDLQIKSVKRKRLHQVNSVPEELQKLIDLQKRLQKICNDNRCVDGYKQFALNLYLAYPKTYSVLMATLNLPTLKMLRHTNINIDTSLSSNVLPWLKSKTQTMKEYEKYCTICIDKMPLKKFLYYLIKEDKMTGCQDIGGKQKMEPATKAYVVMAKGIFLNWEQPLGYCFTSKDKRIHELTAWLEDVISKVMNIGFNVVALVSSHKDIGLNLAAELNVTTIKPYFYIDDKKIYYIFDVPQTLISIRNTLIKYDFSYHDDEGNDLNAHYGSIIALFLVNDERDSPLLDTITKSHIFPNDSEKKELKYVTDIFNKLVSKALEIQCRERPNWQNSNVIGTIKFIELMHDACEVLNSSAIDNAFIGKPFQIETINNILQFLDDVRMLNHEGSDVTATTKWICGLKISVSAIRDLSQDLRGKGTKPLLTQTLNIDALNQFLGSVKQKNKGLKPTAKEFCKYYRQLFMKELLKCPETSYSFDNLNKLLSKLDLKSLYINRLQTDKEQNCVIVGTTDYRFELPETESQTHLCGYLLKKCYEIHRCEVMKKYVHSNIRKEFSNDWKKYNPKPESSLKPPDTFTELIKRMNERFDNYLSNEMDFCVGNGAVMALREITFDGACSCFPINYLRRLFVRFRIYNTIRYNNKHIRDITCKFSVSYQNYLT